MPFSPNGDGINDTWNINTLSFQYPDCTVDVFNRYGQQLFHSEGYSKPWDGTYNKSHYPSVPITTSSTLKMANNQCLVL